ncbi:MAG: diphthine synthase [Candidatus Nanoarchaeia archaeon]|nr:diphthine synthase [Candidatus Nanoarchaeia archaeon]
MLYLVGCGISGHGSITVNGLNACKKSDFVYIERYTGFMDDCELSKLESLIGKKIAELSRNEVESGFEKKILPKASEKNVALMVVGDPLSATTHIELLKECKELNIKCGVIHSSSIHSSLCETGLFIYRFGKSASIPYPEKNYNPTSFFDIVLKNYENDAHTIVFLDIKKDENKYMRVSEGIKILLKISAERNAFFNEETEVIGVCRLGFKDQSIVFCKAKEFSDLNLKGVPQVLIIPKLSPIEREYVEFLYGK